MPNRFLTMPKKTIMTKPKQKFGRQKLDHLTELILSDEIVARDVKLLQNLQNTVKAKITNPSLRGRPKFLPLLYGRYRGKGFPLRTRNNRKYPQWRSLSAWMKVQLGLMVLGERRCLHFRIRFHDQLAAELDTKNVDLKDHLRDRIGRCFRKRLGYVPWYLLVFEDRDKTGKIKVSPHAHGSIEVPRCDLPTTATGQPSIRYRRLMLSLGVEEAEYQYGQMLVKDALKAAAGLNGRPAYWKGKSQGANVWTRTPHNKYFNTNWGNYVFKNVRHLSGELGERRVAFSSSFKSETRRFWHLITKGEDALVLWLIKGKTKP